MALIVEDEVGVEVAWPNRGVPVPGVAMVGILHVALGLSDHLLVAPHVAADLVVA
jgi:hypothetical protein